MKQLRRTPPAASRYHQTGGEGYLDPPEGPKSRDECVASPAWTLLRQRWRCGSERAFEAHGPEGAEFGALAELGGESCGLDAYLAQTEALRRAYSYCEITALARGRFTSVVYRSASGVFNKPLPDPIPLKIQSPIG